MKNYRFELGLAAVFLTVFIGALAFWGDWAGGKMSRQEVDEYLAQKLGFSSGDEVWLETMEGNREIRKFYCFFTHDPRGNAGGQR